MSPKNYDVIAICLWLTSLNSLEGSGATVRVHYLGYPTCWLKLLGLTHLDYHTMLIWPIARF
jgi:hypothetical protein